MATYRRKPETVEAEQWHSGQDPLDGMVYDDSDSVYCIPTLEGLLAPDDGDWIITGAKGERRLCKPDIFEATYEPVEPEAVER